VSLVGDSEIDKEWSVSKFVVPRWSILLPKSVTEETKYRVGNGRHQCKNTFLIAKVIVVRAYEG